MTATAGISSSKSKVVGYVGQSKHRANAVVNPNGIAPTIMENHGKILKVMKKEDKPIRIRKLTPKECWRLMGFSDDDFEKAKQVCSDSQLFKQAGNSIVVDVLMNIFKTML